MEKNTTRVNWWLSATVECQKCKHDNDFMSVDEWQFVVQIGENTDFETPEVMDCEKCGEEIEITGSDY